MNCNLVSSFGFRVSSLERRRQHFRFIRAQTKTFSVSERDQVHDLIAGGAPKWGLRQSHVGCRHRC